MTKTYKLELNILFRNLNEAKVFTLKSNVLEYLEKDKEEIKYHLKKAMKKNDLFFMSDMAAKGEDIVYFNFDDIEEE